MLWLSNFQIGEDRDDMLTVGNMRSSITRLYNEEKQVGKNVKGTLNKVKLDKITDNLQVTCNMMTQKTCDDLQSAITNAEKYVYFKPLDAGLNNTEVRTPLDTTRVKITATSRKFITVISVVLKSAPTGTNYGGTIDENMGIITFAAALPSVEDVIITYNYKGWIGDIEINNITPYLVQEAERFNMTFVLNGK